MLLTFNFLFQDPRLKVLGQNKYYEMKQWFGERWENAIEAAEKNNTES